MRGTPSFQPRKGVSEHLHSLLCMHARGGGTDIFVSANLQAWPPTPRRCLAKSLAHPDEAWQLAKEICQAGGLSPNQTTYNLLAETRIRYEQLCGI